jgi:CheY-like chemotaxis protein
MSGAVLIVDDNPLNLKLTRLLLEVEGYDVRVAADAGQALAELDVFRPDLILMDLQLPGTDGFELTRRLKARPDTRHIVIVALTAYAMKGDEARALAAGCDGYIAKPIETRLLAGQVAAFIGDAKQRP